MAKSRVGAKRPTNLSEARGEMRTQVVDDVPVFQVNDVVIMTAATRKSNPRAHSVTARVIDPRPDHYGRIKLRRVGLVTAERWSAVAWKLHFRTPEPYQFGIIKVQSDEIFANYEPGSLAYSFALRVVETIGKYWKEII